MSKAKRKDKKKRLFYLKFVTFVFYIILATYLVLGIVFFVLRRYSIITIFTPQNVDVTLLLVLFLVGALMLGLAISCFTASIFLRPINRLSEATKKVAGGDFGVELENPDKDSEMGELIDNFNKMVRDLRYIETLKTDFVADVSHEFKTPLSTIQGYSALLQDENLSAEERKAYTDYLIEATKQLSSLTTNILKLSKLENRDCAFERARFDVAEQIRRTILALEPQWSEKNLELDVELTTAELYLNEELVSGIWSNILSNAIKFTPDGGKIRVISEAEGGIYTVSICDNGVGMSEEVKSRIFDKFYQGDTSHKSEGNGLGLALVKRVLDICGGTVSVDSAPGEGSTFTVRLPLYKKLKFD